MAGKPLKKPTGPKAPKKPTSRSKTGNAQCSEAASNWQLALRGKASLNPQTHATLGKCRALAAAKKGAGLREASGKYSEQGRAALEGRLQKRFDSDLVTQKSRAELLEKKLAWRKQQNDQIKKHQESGDTKALMLAGKTRSAGFDAAQRRESRAAATGMSAEDRARKALRTSSLLNSRRQAQESVKRGPGAQMLVSSGESNLRKANSDIAAMREQRKSLAKPAPVTTGAAVPAKAKYSLGGALAPGRGTIARSTVAASIIEGRKKNSVTGEYAGYQNAGGNVIPNPGKSLKDRVEQKKLVAQLNTYERSYAAQWQQPKPPARDEHAHSTALMRSGLTPEGLMTARHIAGKAVTAKPGIVVVERKPATVAAAPVKAKYSLGGALAPGRGTSDRQEVADKLKMVRRTAKTSMQVAEHLRPTRYVDKYGGGSGIMIPEPFDANQARREVYLRMNLTRDYEQARRKARTLTRKANKLKAR